MIYLCGYCINVCFSPKQSPLWEQRPLSAYDCQWFPAPASMLGPSWGLDKYLLNEHMYVHCNILYVFNCLKWWSLCYQLSFVLIIIILLKTYLIIRNKWLLIRKRLIYPTIMEGQRCARHGREMNKQSQFFHGKICNWE